MRQYLQFMLIWVAIALGAAIIVDLFGLPARMECSGGVGRYSHCKHGLLAPETWRRP